MIVSKLSSKAILAEQILNAIVKHLDKYSQSTTAHQMNALLCIILIAQTQPKFKLSTNIGKYLVQMDMLVEYLADATRTYETSKFLQQLLGYIIDQALEEQQEQQEQKEKLFVPSNS
jgi:hypothetical protein